MLFFIQKPLEFWRTHAFGYGKEIKASGNPRGWYQLVHSLQWTCCLWKEDPLLTLNSSSVLCIKSAHLGSDLTLFLASIPFLSRCPSPPWTTSAIKVIPLASGLLISAFWYFLLASDPGLSSTTTNTPNSCLRVWDLRLLLIWIETTTSKSSVWKAWSQENS